VISHGKFARIASLASCFLISIYFFITGTFPVIPSLTYLLSITIFFLSFIDLKSIGRLVSLYRIDLVMSCLLIAASLGLYLYRLTEITPGAWGDEITLGYMTEDLAKLKTFTPFLTSNYGHPTPLIYISQIFISVMGKSLTSLRIVSVLFGALNVGIIYLFLRFYFKRLESLLGAFLFATSYVHVIVTRFAYEMSAAIFFLILSSYLLSLLHKTKKQIYVVFFGLSVAAGIYTYLAFRPIALMLFSFGAISILKEKQYRLRHFILLMTAVFIISVPLLSYSIHHSGDLNLRIKSLNVFSQELPVKEIVKELQGASYRTLTMFFFTGDPNPRQNPANTTPFDIVTSLLFLSGFLYLFIKKRSIFFVALTLTGIILATEIITLERIPEFHYYGLGHPNTLRISLLAPIVAFVSLWALKSVVDKSLNSSMQKVVMIFIVLIICAININRYYHQKMNQWIYSTNFVVPLRIIEILNKQKPLIVHLSPSLNDNLHIKYLLDPSIKTIQTSKPVDCSFNNIPLGLTYIAIEDIKDCPKKMLQAFIQSPSQYVSFMTSPWKTLDVIMFSR